MNRPLYFVFLLAIISTSINCDSSESLPPCILIDSGYLSNNKKLIKENSPQLMPAFEQLIKDAEIAMGRGPYSVTDKEKLPPSGNKHDYSSYSRYWWPDPSKPDGLPYIRRDGETNPASQNLAASDRPRIGAFTFDSETLGLAYYFTGNEKYAQKLAELLRVWFLDQATKMNPNLNHAQCRPGHNEGSKSGILDGRLMIKALEASLLISNSNAISDHELQALRTWANDYFKWLTTNEMALAEASSKNNHGSYYDAQAAYFGLYAGNKVGATEILNNFYKKRIIKQILADGSMPEELARTRPLFYSVYNMHAMFCVAQLAKQVDVDLFKADDKNARLRTGLDYLTPYTAKEKSWPRPTIDEMDKMDFYPILLMADLAYPTRNYEALTQQLDSKGCQRHRANLALPLMR